MERGAEVLKRGKCLEHVGDLGFSWVKEMGCGFGARTLSTALQTVSAFSGLVACKAMG